MAHTRKLIEGDNLAALRRMAAESVDLIYLDPPFKSDKNYAAPIGSQAAGAAFTDTWSLDDIKKEWVEDIQIVNQPAWAAITAAGFTHSDSAQAYLTYMAIRLIEVRRVLKNTGSVYLHCDPTMSHYLKLLMDALFGKKNFRNEIVWHYPNRMPAKSKKFQAKHDIVLIYSKTNIYAFNPIMVPGVRVQKDIERGWGTDTITSDGEKIRRLRVYDKAKVDQASNEGRLSYSHYSAIVDQTQKSGDTPCSDVWNINLLNPMSKERTGWPTQKPLALVERIIKASSNPGDVVLDPFCGCATACVAAEKLDRQWIGIDLSRDAIDISIDRLARDVQIYEDGGLLGNVTVITKGEQYALQHRADD